MADFTAKRFTAPSQRQNHYRRPSHPSSFAAYSPSRFLANVIEPRVNSEEVFPNPLFKFGRLIGSKSAHNLRDKTKPKQSPAAREKPVSSLRDRRQVSENTNKNIFLQLIFCCAIYNSESSHPHNHKTHFYSCVCARNPLIAGDLCFCSPITRDKINKLCRVNPCIANE